MPVCLQKSFIIQFIHTCRFIRREAFSDIDSESTKLVRQQLYILQHSYDLGI